MCWFKVIFSLHTPVCGPCKMISLCCTFLFSTSGLHRIVAFTRFQYMKMEVLLVLQSDVMLQSTWIATRKKFLASPTLYAGTQPRRGHNHCKQNQVWEWSFHFHYIWCHCKEVPERC